MTETIVRMTDPDRPPSEADVAAWIGKEAFSYWKEIAQTIEDNYPGVFAPEWLFGGKKHGWSLRYKKSKSFCAMIPERNRLALVIVFGAKERLAAEKIRGRLSPRTRRAYDDAATYADGKWLLLAIDADIVVKDVWQLLTCKRKPPWNRSDRAAGREKRRADEKH